MTTKVFDSKLLQYLSFSDYDVEKFEYDLQRKFLKIELSGCLLCLNGGLEIGRGCLYCNNWEDLSVRRFVYGKNLWEPLNSNSFEILVDIHEAVFSDQVTTLSGFGEVSGCWVSWEIVGAYWNGQFKIPEAVTFLDLF